MYNTLKRLYLTDKINGNGLSNAVKKGWITEEQKQEIIASKVA